MDYCFVGTSEKPEVEGKPQSKSIELDGSIAEMIRAECREIIAETVKNAFAPVVEMELISKKEFLNEYEVESLFSIPVATLRTDRCRNRGPRYIKYGQKVLYPKKEVADHYLTSLVKIRK